MTKTFTLKLKGTKKDLETADILLRVLGKYNKMGMNIVDAMQMMVVVSINTNDIEVMK